MHPLLKRTALATEPLWDPLWIALYRARHGYRAPIPPFTNRDRIGARNVGWFVEGGRLDYQTFRQAIERHTADPLPALSVLDFGAGGGRILAHFAGHESANGWRLAASDVDPTAIAYLRRAWPQVDSRVNASEPPLPFEAGRFDVLYAFSVWTHLPPEAQARWLAEAGRVLRPGGLALITTLGFYGLELLSHSAAPLEAEWWGVSADDLRRQGVIYHEYAVLGQALPEKELFSGIQGSYGVSVHDPAYVRRAWADQGFEVLEIIERAMHGHQDLIVLRRG